jgi:Putative peptidoglycan binding domain
MRENMKSIVYSACIGILALALAAGGAQAATDKNKRQERAKPQQRSANVHAARPANTGRSMSAHRNVAATQNRQRSYAKPRTSTAVNRAPRQASAARANASRPASTTAAKARAQRNVAVKTPAKRPASATAATARERNASVNRNRNAAMNRDRNVEINRERNIAANRTKNASANRELSVAVNRTQNTAFYRGGNVRVTNNWRGDAFRGQRYAAFRNYNRQWHDRSWWRSHYTRIVFVNNGWWYWNANYWYPAWGFAPSVSYVYDGPVYGYNGLSPEQVTINVQQQLAAAGYYDGPIDGELGPMTREAIANYQADNGLVVTSAIDEPTLATMGLV